eukprot:jgi/Ulvmu1/9352/UM050_0104.1
MPLRAQIESNRNCLLKVAKADLGHSIPVGIPMGLFIFFNRSHDWNRTRQSILLQPGNTMGPMYHKHHKAGADLLRTGHYAISGSREGVPLRNTDPSSGCMRDQLAEDKATSLMSATNTN